MTNVIKEMQRPNGTWVLRWAGKLGYTFGFVKTGGKRAGWSEQTIHFDRVADLTKAVEVFEKRVAEIEAQS